MPADALRRYLQDHLAGSVAALQLMETLADHERGRPLEQKLRGLHYEVTEEQERLKAILARLEGEEGSLKRAAAWLTEKLHRGRLAFVERADPGLARLEGLESLALGLQGKLALYRALEDIAPDEPRLRGYPFAALQARTLIQHAMVEQERMAAARAAFAQGDGSSGMGRRDGSSMDRRDGSSGMDSRAESGDTGEWGA
jgi:hypothetical protein